MNILTWEGYADTSVIEPFEAATGCKVSATYVGSNDDFAPKLAAGGGVFDIVTPSIDTTKSLIDAGFVQPIDISKIEAWDDLYEKFTSAEGLHKDGKVYGVPYAWGAIPFMYLKDKFPTPPTSISVLWDPELKGRVSLWDDKSALYVAARLNGDMNRPSSANSGPTSENTGRPPANWSTSTNQVKSGFPTPGVGISHHCWRLKALMSLSSFRKRVPRAGWTAT